MESTFWNPAENESHKGIKEPGLQPLLAKGETSIVVPTKEKIVHILEIVQVIVGVWLVIIFRFHLLRFCQDCYTPSIL